ncbi:hypothetical protein [Clostridium sp. YIM B02506]|uniref:polysaccharide biosynthesis C-terminal domain-containing protein n=1 Tax=Clostridium sp. YIM B02506 TaxID=2910680 RepID=UPI001EED44BC|nr:hypothetical protein [Clostridium sp. YIM B02506]
MIIMESQGFKIIKLATYNKRLNDEDKYGRIMTEKGELAILPADDINFLAYCDFIKGKEPRGNHYHKEKIEYLYVCKGRLKVYIKKAEDSEAEVQTFEIQGGDIVCIETGYTHAVETIEEGYGIEFSKTKQEIIKQDSFYEKITEI